MPSQIGLRGLVIGFRRLVIGDFLAVHISDPTNSGKSWEFPEIGDPNKVLKYPK